MNKYLFRTALLLGAAAVVWIGYGFANTNILALTMTVVIGVVYGFGAFELRQFRSATSTLANSLVAIPDNLQNLSEWLVGVPASLQNSVRSRVEGDRVGLPGPALTPYLVGLLVMLGMLGTFLGMVITLNGAVFALEGTTDLQAMRSSLAAPIRGLGLAFGTSVAGVATSAMLGLMSALSRRERMLTAQLLDTKIATVLRGFSLAHQRQETFKALQLQSHALPEVVDKLQTMMSQMERMSQQLNERLLTNQENFHSEVKVVYSELAGSVDKSLRESLSQSAQVAGENIKPAVHAAIAGIAQEAKLIHERMFNTVQTQLDGISDRFSATTSTVTNSWTAALTRHEQANAALVATVADAYATSRADQTSGDQQRMQAWTHALETVAADLQREWQQAGTQTLGETTRLMTCAEDLMRTRLVAEANWLEQQRGRMDELSNVLRTELGALREEEALRGDAAVERLGELQTALTSHLTTLGIALEDPITRLIQTALEAPRAAAEVIGQLRQEISNSVARDNELLEERGRIMETLNSLLDSIGHASVEQRAVIDSLVANSAVALNHAGIEFSEKVSAEAAKLSDIAAHVTSSAVEVSSLSEAFGFAVHSFSQANEKLIANLQRIEGAMDKSMLRSDDQLAYYVAQAREIIDLSIMSQKEIFEELRQLPAKQALLAEEVG